MDFLIILSKVTVLSFVVVIFSDSLHNGPAGPVVIASCREVIKNYNKSKVDPSRNFTWNKKTEFLEKCNF